MARVYAVLIVTAIIFVLAAALKHEMKAAAAAEATIAQEQQTIAAKDNTIQFERDARTAAETRAAALEADNRKKEQERALWQKRYADLKKVDPQVAQWAATPVPPPVVDSLRSRDAARSGNGVRSPDVAPKVQPGVPNSGKPGPTGNDERRPAPGAGGGLRRTVGLQPAT